MSTKPNRASVVKSGGIAQEPADVEDVTRDTYGPQPVGRDRGKRLAEAERAAGASGIPGVAIPEPPVFQPADIKARDEEVRRTEISGDRVASRRDAEKIGRKPGEARGRRSP
jgi:hypothetical protein